MSEETADLEWATKLVETATPVTRVSGLDEPGAVTFLYGPGGGALGRVDRYDDAKVIALLGSVGRELLRVLDEARRIDLLDWGELGEAVDAANAALREHRERFGE